MRKVLLTFCSCLTLVGCATGTPVAVTYQGHSLNGEGASSKDLMDFAFSVSDGSVACHGGYDMRNAFAPEFTFPISCSDGRTGRVAARREAKATDKLGVDFPVRGKIIFSDGSIGMFNLGADARSINTNSIIYQQFNEGLAQTKFK